MNGQTLYTCDPQRPVVRQPVALSLRVSCTPCLAGTDTRPVSKRSLSDFSVIQTRFGRHRHVCTANMAELLRELRSTSVPDPTHCCDSALYQRLSHVDVQTQGWHVSFGHVTWATSATEVVFLLCGGCCTSWSHE